MTFSIKHIFVYGSLRPDDDSGQSWTVDAVRGLKAEKALLRGARLYHDQYACAVLDSALSRASDQSVDVKIHVKSESSDPRGVIRGYVLSTDDPQLFQQKLALFDSIEGYKGPNSSNNMYDRSVLDVELASLGNNDGQSSEGKSIKAFVYHGTHRCNMTNPIASGDWLKRER